MNMRWDPKTGATEQLSDLDDVCVCGACEAPRGSLWARLDARPGDACSSVPSEPEQPEPACFCAPVDDDEPKRHRRGDLLGMAFAALVIGFALGALTACAHAPRSRAYEVCRMACERAGCSTTEQRQVCAVAEVLP